MTGQHKLREQVEAFVPENHQERQDREIMLRLLDACPNLLNRTNRVAHATASAWIVNPARDRALMVFHRIYQAWTWCGGHADGDGNLCAVARREAGEESGITGLTLLREGPVSLELIAVQAHERKGVYIAPHLHLNLTFLFETADDRPLRPKPDENSAAAWRTLEQIRQDRTEPHMLAYYEKLMARTPPAG